jgi:hypothetical protein
MAARGECAFFAFLFECGPAREAMFPSKRVLHRAQYDGFVIRVNSHQTIDCKRIVRVKLLEPASGFITQRFQIDLRGVFGCHGDPSFLYA